MSFVLSSAVPNPIVAMTFMPLLLLIQLVMAGVLFELEDGSVSAMIANFTVSKWGMTAFGKIGDICSIPSVMAQKKFEVEIGGVTQAVDKIEPDGGWISQADLSKYGVNAAEPVVCWLIFIAFIVAFFIFSVWALKATTKKIKK